MRESKTVIRKSKGDTKKYKEKKILKFIEKKKTPGDSLKKTVRQRELIVKKEEKKQEKY